jgi:hypothetical protein
MMYRQTENVFYKSEFVHEEGENEGEHEEEEEVSVERSASQYQQNSHRHFQRLLTTICTAHDHI